MLLVLSVSGNSKNLIKASSWFKKKGGVIFAILGCKGGKLKKHYVPIPSLACCS